MDGWPDSGHIVTAAELQQCAPRQVVGTTHPFTVAFTEFLQARFLGEDR